MLVKIVADGSHPKQAGTLRSGCLRGRKFPSLTSRKFHEARGFLMESEVKFTLGK